MKKTITELIIQEIVDKYSRQKILNNRLKNKSTDRDTYSLCLNNKDIVHVFEEIYIDDLKTYLRKDMSALCDSKFMNLKDIVAGLKEKEVKHLLCQINLENIKVCSECVSILYK